MTCLIIMSCEDTEDNETMITSTSGYNRPSNISRELVDAAFGYQQEIMGLRHKQAMLLMRPKERHPTEIKNEALKERSVTNKKCIHKLETKRAEARARQETDSTRIKDLMKSRFSLLGHASPNCPIPHDIMLRCRQAIEAVDAIPS